MNWIETLPKWLFSAGFTALVALLVYLGVSGTELKYTDGIRFIPYDEITKNLVGSNNTEFNKFKNQIKLLTKNVDELKENSSERIEILALIRVRNGVVISSTPSVNFNSSSGVVTFLNPKNLNVTPIISDSSPGHYITTTNYVREIISTTKIKITRTALDTGDRNWSGDNFNLVVLGE